MRNNSKKRNNLISR